MIEIKPSDFFKMERDIRCNFSLFLALQLRKKSFDIKESSLAQSALETAIKLILSQHSW